MFPSSGNETSKKNIVNRILPTWVHELRRKYLALGVTGEVDLGNVFLFLFRLGFGLPQIVEMNEMVKFLITLNFPQLKTVLMGVSPRCETGMRI